MAILHDYKFKGIPVRTYLSASEHFQVQKQINRTPLTTEDGAAVLGEDGQPLFAPPEKLWTITVDLFFWTEDREHFLESRPFHFTVPTMDGFGMDVVYQKVSETYPGEAC